MAMNVVNAIVFFLYCVTDWYDFVLFSRLSAFISLVAVSDRIMK